MEKFFKLKENGTTVRAEVLAGLTTFMSMAYILLVNPGMFADLQDAYGVTFGANYIATAVSAIVGTLLIGLLAKLPLAQASGMGLNAYFVYTCCFGLGFTFANALVFVLADGLIFVILTATGLRRLIFDAIPREVKIAIPAGIGLFIAFIGMQDTGLIVNDDSTLLGLASFRVVGETASWAHLMPLVVTVATLIAIAILSKRGVKGAILLSILGGAVLYYVLGLTVPGFYDSFAFTTLNPFDAFADFGKYSFFKVFTEGFDFSAYVAANGAGSLVLNFIASALAFCMVDMFDTMGTLYGACRAGNMLVKNKKGEDEVPNMDKAMLADAIATCTGAVCGTSTVTTFVESSAGVAAGGRTGLTSCVIAALFAVAMFLAPVAALIPACAYGAALIYVGILMIGCVADIDWKDPQFALPAFMTMVMMPFTYNISYGIFFGLFTYIFLKLFDKKDRKINAATWVITLLFLAMILLTH